MPITKTFSYQGEEVSPGNTITGFFTITRGSFANVPTFNLADAPTCLALSCDFEMTNGSGVNTWNPSNIGASFFNVLLDAAGNAVDQTFIHVGSGPFGLFVDNPGGDRVVDNGTQFPGPGETTNGTPGTWTLTATTEALPMPEPATLTLLAAGVGGIGLLVWRRRRSTRSVPAPRASSRPLGQR